jgi:hypothetical protein
MAEISFEDLKNELSLIVAILIVASVLYFIGKNLITKIPKEVEISTAPVQKIEIDEKIFENKLLNSLNLIDEFTLPAESEIGRENPFAPY